MLLTALSLLALLVRRHNETRKRYFAIRRAERSAPPMTDWSQLGTPLSEMDNRNGRLFSKN